MDSKAIKKISKRLSYILRHNPSQFGLQLDSKGWCEVDALIRQFNAHNIPLDRGMLETVVRLNDKKRFSFNTEDTHIRANQGHSVEVDLEWAPVPPPQLLYHGTARSNLPSIRKNGLHRKSRHHVHLSGNPETARQVGQRHGPPEVLTVRAAAMHEDGYSFFYSANGVWLTDQVPPAYLF